MWHAAYVKTGFEQDAGMSLEEHDFETFCPMMGEEAAFKGYVFVNIKPEQDATPINRVSTVLRLVSFGQRDTTMTDDEVDNLKSRDWTPPKTLQPGDKVRIIKGPFEGTETTIHSRKGNIITLPVTFIGDTRLLEFHTKSVAA